MEAPYRRNEFTVWLGLMLGLAAAYVCPVRAEVAKATNSIPAIITCDVRIIEGPRDEINKLIPSTTYQLSAEQLRKLDELVSQKKATILAQPHLITTDGVPAQVRSVKEMIYPVEYSQPCSAPVRGMSWGIPWGLKTREVGALLNITPTIIEQGNWVSCVIIPEISLFGGYEQFNGFAEHGKLQIPQPIFSSYNSTTTAVLPSGATVLLGVHDYVRLPKQDKVIIVLLSAAVVR